MASSAMGGSFINYFNRFGRQWQVYVEAEGAYRDRAENVGEFYVRNNKGDMVAARRRYTQVPAFHAIRMRVTK